MNGNPAKIGDTMHFLQVVQSINMLPWLSVDTLIRVPILHSGQAFPGLSDFIRFHSNHLGVLLFFLLWQREYLRSILLV